MLRQYGTTCGRFRLDAKGRRVGVVPVGEIIYIDDRPNPVTPARSPWIVEAWIPRVHAAYRNGRFVDRFMHGGHLAVVRCLRTGRRTRCADWLLLHSRGDT